jgi:two-component system OmpR family response regulator
MDGDQTRGSVVLVDDELSVRRLLSEALRLEGFEVETAASAEEGWQVIDRMQPDVAVVDVMMPGGDGLGLLSRLRGSVRHHDLPVAMLTTRAQQEDIERGRRAGADVYVTKPFSIEQLVWHLDELRVKERAPAPTATLDSLGLRRHGPLSLQAIVERTTAQPVIAVEAS